MDLKSIYLIVGGLAGLLILYFLLDFFFRRKVLKMKTLQAEKQAKDIIDTAKKELEIKKKELDIKAQKELFEAKSSFERSTKSIRNELDKKRKQMKVMEINAEKKMDMVSRKESALRSREKAIIAKEKANKKKEEELEQMLGVQNRRLEQIAGLTAEEAKRILIDNLTNQAKAEAQQKIRQIEEQAEKQAEKKAKEIIIGAIQRCSADVVVESTVSVVSLPSDELKGRIIGREGRNIRAFELVTGVDVIVDDTPGAITLSGYDPINREIARISMEKLLTDGRIHPARIEETVEKAKKEIEVMIQESGEQICFELGVFNLHPELIKYLGKLRFRTSYGQNVLAHSKEVASLAGIMAAELGLDVDIAKKAGLLHDIGKAIDRTVEGTHTQLGHDLAKKYINDPIVLNAILAHHEDVPVISPITVLIQAADTVSGARPGARRETLENYVKRLERLEELADSFVGVAKSYAIQAGREIRVIVDPENINDDQANNLASEIAQKIQSELEYPGQIKVTVIRERRAINYAK